jgi:hypothetical protein
MCIGREISAPSPRVGTMKFPDASEVRGESNPNSSAIYRGMLFSTCSASSSAIDKMRDPANSNDRVSRPRSLTVVTYSRVEGTDETDGRLDMSAFEEIYGGSKPAQTAAAVPRWKTPGKSPASTSHASDVGQDKSDRVSSSPERTLKFTGSSFKKEGADQKPRAEEPVKPVEPSQQKQSTFSKFLTDLSKIKDRLGNLYKLV